MRFLKSKLFIVTVFFLGIAIGLFLHKINTLKEKPKESFQLEHLYPANGHLVNPLLGVDNPEGADAKLEGIKYSVQAYIRGRKEKGDVSRVSVYIRDLSKGAWVGISADDNFAAASLLKVPLLIAYLKMAEEDPAFLGKQLKYENALNLPPQNVAPGKTLQLGDSYTIDQLLRYLIVYSDNVASEFLLNNLDPKYFSGVFSDLQLSVPDLEGGEYQISAKGYATFFRVLYNATYLNAQLSEKAIKLLSESEFNGGIVAGVPAGLTVAHKFGERKYQTKDLMTESAQLHDCGIVYYPQRPYLLCVMTKGRDMDVLKGVIRDISKIVYEHQGSAMDVL